MELTTCLLVIGLLLVCSVGWGQITLKEKKAPLEKVLEDIERQTRYVFLYDPEEMKMGPITIDVKNATIRETLGKCFKGEPIEFTIIGNNILLKKKRAGNSSRSASFRIQDTKTFKINDHAAPGNNLP